MDEFCKMLDEALFGRIEIERILKSKKREIVIEIRRHGYDVTVVFVAEQAKILIVAIDIIYDRVYVDDLKVLFDDLIP